MCDNHSNIIFDDDITYLTKEMIRLYGPYESYFGCNYLDYLVSAWENTGHEDPVIAFKEEGVYELLKNLVDKYIVSHTLYRGPNTDHNYDINVNELKVGSLLNYNWLSSWSTDIEIAHAFADQTDPIVFKLTAENLVGLDLSYKGRDSIEKEIILSHYTLKIIDEDIYTTINYKNEKVEGKLFILSVIDL